MIHVAPLLIMSEEQLQDGFSCQDDALYTLDEALGYLFHRYFKISSVTSLIFKEMHIAS